MKTETEDDIVDYFLRHLRSEGEGIGFFPVFSSTGDHAISQNDLFKIINALDKEIDYFNIMLDHVRKLRNATQELYLDRRGPQERKCFNCGIVLPAPPPGPIEPPPFACSHPDCREAQLKKIQSWGLNKHARMRGNQSEIT